VVATPTLTWSRPKKSQPRRTRYPSVAPIAQQTDFEGCKKKEKKYGDRWAVEGAYSCIKRIFGEYVSAKKLVNMVKEMATKVSLYNLFMRITPHGGG
jgi:hypothetical protein